MDVSVALTDATGAAIPQDANYRQGGRIADTRVPPLRRVEVRAWSAGTDVVTARLLWSRLAQTSTDGLTTYLAGFAYRPSARLECGGFDPDADLLVNACDNCPLASNADQADFDRDAIGNLCDSDDDNDRLSDAAEALYGTDPRNPDHDADGILDGRDVEWVQSVLDALP